MATPIWHDAWEALCDKWSRQGYAALSPNERTWLNVRSLIDSIENGGLISYFYNNGADTIADCMPALDALNASDVRRQVERVSALFGDPLPPSEIRNEIIESWPDGDPAIDRIMIEVDEALMPMMSVLELKLEAFLLRCRLAKRAP